MSIEQGFENLKNSTDIQTEISDFFEGLGIDKEERNTIKKAS